MYIGTGECSQNRYIIVPGLSLSCCYLKVFYKAKKCFALSYLVHDEAYKKRQTNRHDYWDDCEC